LRGFGRPRVLVVDDEDVVLSVCARVLLQAGYEPLPTMTGAEALSVVDAHSLDAALIDVRLPDLDGPEVIAALRARDADLPCVVMSGYASFDDAVRCLQRGAVDFLRKPFDVEQLVRVIDHAISTTHLRSDSALLAATRSIFATLDADRIAGHVLEVARSMLSAEDVLLARADGHDPGPTLRLSGKPGAPPRKEGPLPTRAWDRLIELREAAIFSSSSSGGDVEIVASLMPEARSVLTHRLAVGDQLVGLLAAGRPAWGRDFGERDLRRASLLVGQASLALENARLHSSLAAQKRELESAIDRLIVAERAAMTARLSAALGHEISNPTNAILHSVEAAELALARSQDHELTAALKRARAGANAVLDICRALRPLSVARGVRSDVIDMRQVIESAALIASAELRARARLVVDVAADLPTLRGDVTRLGQVFLNLLVNAAHAIPSGAAERHEVRVSARGENGAVVARVEDTGPGVAPELVPDLFQAGVTSRAVAEGHGTGLAVCRWIVEDAGGTIGYQPREGGGACFWIRLPAG
jgi:signal transduction histidine kinase/FixJ family two-component response regulator